MRQIVHPGRRPGWTAVAAALGTLAAGLSLSGCSPSVAEADTTLHRTAGVTIVHPDGSTAPGAEGLRVQPGDVVRTATGGRAELVTRTRTVYVGSDAAVQVLDGARQSLRHGAVVVNALRGPELSMTVASLTVNAPAGSAVRAERSVTVRVGTLAGTAEVNSSAGRRVAVTALHQTMVGGDALPDSTTPLRLTDDDGEARTVPDLVREDRTLLGLARGMDSTGRATVHVVQAAVDYGQLSAPAGTGRSEKLLPAVIAAAGPNDGALDRYHSAVRFRSAGGSWAVVARLVGVRAPGVVAALAAFERTQPPGQVGNVQDVLAGLTGGATGGGGDGTSGDGSDNGSGNGPGSGNDGSGDGGNGDGDGGDGGNPSPTPSPSSSGLVDTVRDTVGSVLSIVPTPSPTRTGLVPDPVVSVPLPGVTLPALSPQR